MSKDNLILISPMLHQGGFERVCVTTARLLEPYYNVSIVIFDDKDIAYDIKGLNVINLNLGVREGKIAKISTVLKRVKALKKIKSDLKPEISYSLGTTANIVNSLSRTKETKVWLGLRSYMDMMNPEVIKLFVKKADLILACSKVIEDELREKYGFDKAITLYNPYDTQKIREGATKPVKNEEVIDKDALNIVSMGREDPVKGFWHSIKAFSLIKDKYPSTKLIFIGDGDFSDYKKLANDLGCEGRVIFAGLQTNPYRMLGMGKIYLLTSENEGFPNALVEAMALGLVPISCDCMTGPKEIIGDNEFGILLPEFKKGIDLDPNNITGDDKLLADKISMLLDDEELRLSISEKAAKRAEDFSCENYVNEILKAAGYKHE